MIRDLSEYLLAQGENVDASHPRGDLNRIMIDGSVMPLRPVTTDVPYAAKSVLRGEDAAFILEAILERAQCLFTIGSPNDYKFSRKLGKTLKEVLNLAFRDPDLDYNFIYTSNLNPLDNVSDNYITEMVTSGHVKRSDLNIDIGSFDRGNTLSGEAVENLFWALQSLFCMWMVPPDASIPSYTEEKHDLNPEYPFRSSLTGNTFIASGGIDEYNRYGGYGIGSIGQEWCIGQRGDASVPFVVDPGSAEMWMVHKWSASYQHYSDGVWSEYRREYHNRWMKLADGVIENHLINVNRTAEQNKDTLLGGLAAYFGITPDFIRTPCERIVCGFEPANGANALFVKTGDHTKWWS